jgi:TrmH family RNA methyltransferase
MSLPPDSPPAPLAEALERIRIVMVRSRSPGNVGSAARAMMNFGLSRLVLAAQPTFEDPDFFPVESRKLAWKATPILDACQQTETMEAALTGATLCFGTAPRELQGARTLTPRQASRELLQAALAGREVALVFGGEADGLRNHEHSLLSGIVRIPTGEDYQDLNLAQSVVVCCYELFQVGQELTGLAAEPTAQEPPAPFQETRALLQAAEGLLQDAGFLKATGPSLVEELQRVGGRAGLTSREVQIFRGMLRQLGWAIRNGPGDATVPVPRPPSQA